MMNGTGRQSRDQMRGPVEDRIRDQAVVHDHRDAARQPHHQRDAQQIARSVHEPAGQLLLAHPAGEADDDGEQQEERGQLGEPPAQRRQADPRSFQGMTL